MYGRPLLPPFVPPYKTMMNVLGYPDKRSRIPIPVHPGFSSNGLYMTYPDRSAVHLIRPVVPLINQWCP